MDGNLRGREKTSEFGWKMYQQERPHGVEYLSREEKKNRAAVGDASINQPIPPEGKRKVDVIPEEGRARRGGKLKPTVSQFDQKKPSRGAWVE